MCACGGTDQKPKPPTPKAAKKPVTTGVIVQLRLAVESFDTIFDLRAPEQDLLPLLVHAWATFYHRTDPAPTAARACHPASPKTSTIRSEQPLTTAG